MLLNTLHIFLILSSFLGGTHPSDKSPESSCQRKQLEGFWYYKEAPESTILREKDQAGERLGEIGVMIHYTIRWKTGCDHDFVVKAVYTDIGKITPATFKPHLFKVGEVISYHITAVYKDSMKYEITYKGKTTTAQVLHRVPKEWMKKK